MPIEIGGIQLHRVHKITALEQGSFVYHQVPGLEGEIVQDLGRQSVRLRIEGIFYGPAGAENLEALRNLHKQREPVDFLAEIVGQAYFSQVTLDHLELKQSATEPDQFSFVVVVVEYVPPPEPPEPEALPEVDAAILDQAASFMDAVDLPDTLGQPTFQDPIEPMKGLLSGVQSALTPLEEVSGSLAELFGTG